MTYEQWITASTTWTCPKAGIWEIICVGGGASGGPVVEKTLTQNPGGTTSFGSYLSAAGGQKGSATNAGTANPGGVGGYTGLDYGGAGYTINSSPTKNGGGNASQGLGYGAGGGVIPSSSTSTNGFGGNCGELKSITLDLTTNQQIACTIGAGGAAVTNSTAGKAGCIHVRFIQ